MKIALVLIALVCVVFAIEERVLVVQVKHTSHEDALFALLSEKKILPQPVLPTSYKLRAAQYKSSKSYSELSRYYTINLSQVSGDVNSIQDELLSKDFISAAYFKPVGSLAVYEVPTVSQPLIPQAEKTPSFVKRQTYLDGPGGFNVSAVSKVPGARGTDVTLVDIEGSWIWEHEDLIDKKGKTLFGKTIDSSMWWNHGTAVLGVVAGVDNDFGVTGIAPETAVFGAPYNQSTGLNIAQVVLKAKEFVRAGDIILIELHAPSHRGYTAMEWFPDNAEAFKLVTDDGVIIVEAAGNGNQDFDDPIFDKPMKGFPDTWKNPFRRKEIDSGAILVGAGAPPIGTHGKDHGPDRSRLGFSNYGSCVDVQGWGREVTTMGYGDLYGGDTKTHYTDQFSGTSSASPCVVGVVASIQGITKAAGKPVLTPKTVRELLRKTGKPQVDAPGRPKSQRIGTRPDLGELYEELVKNNFFAK